MTVKDVARAREGRNPRVRTTHPQDQQLINPARRHAKAEFAQNPNVMQRAILCVLGFNEEYGRIIVDQVTAEEFDGDYADIAGKIIAYWKEYNEPPKEGLDLCILRNVKDDGKRRIYIHIYQDLLFMQDRGLNGRFVADRIHDFKRAQSLKAATLKTAELIRNPEANLEEIEGLWRQELDEARHKDQFDGGTRLTAVRETFDYLEGRAEEFLFRIRDLDSRHVVPARQEVCLLIGATGSGKTWALIHVGKWALICRYKVLHVTLEMPEKQVNQRYWQSLFAVPTHSREDFEVAVFDKDDEGNFVSFHMEPVLPDFSLDAKSAPQAMAKRLAGLRGKVDNLRIRQFASGTLSPHELRAYLRQLDQREGFKPDMVIVDYIGIMKTKDRQEAWKELQRNLIVLRQIAHEFNVAVLTAQQTNRQGAQSRKVSHTEIAGSWGLNMDADCIITYSQTAEEKEHNLARLHVAKARAAQDKFDVAIAQNYALGQFALDSVVVNDAYKDLLKDMTAATIELPPDKVEALMRTLKEGQWRADRRSPEWVGKAVAQVFQIELDHRGREAVSNIIDKLLREGRLVKYEAKDENRMTREFIGPKDADPEGDA